MCPLPFHASLPEVCVCSSERPGELCTRVQLTAARLRMVGDELHQLTVRRKTSLGRKRLCTCFYLLYTATHLAALALLMQGKRSL
ncbi:hypothetical protein GDO78_007536 [Eleutherodactylus coqui]|uniref:Transmembrane protein n=1 Tax=Eleutherodactylus coqui TaxID=57060 RepID=A0A8J6FJF9_ELECQ|nr:hypothetical protein GDO78_007536 [Eleutherodactylus coqui]